MINIKKNKFILPLALLIIGLLLPLVSGNHTIELLIPFLITAYLGQCWNLMSGYAGQFSFGHAAFFGIGAYTSSLLYVKCGVNPYLGLLIGMVISGIVGLIIGYLSFRYKIKGNYFALVTLAFAEIFRVLVNNVPAFNGASGILIPYADDFRVFQFSDRKVYYIIIFVMLALLTFLIAYLQKTKFGLYLVALRDDEDAANALGVNVLKYKLCAIALSAMLTAAVGTFYAQYYTYIDSGVVFNASISIDAIVPCIVGGVGTVFGPVLGAFIIGPLKEIIDTYLSAFAGLNMVVYGVIIVLIVMFCPDGIIGIVRGKIKKRKKAELTGGKNK